MTSPFLAKKGFEIIIVQTFLLKRKDCLKVICFDDIIKTKLHLKIHTWESEVNITEEL